MAMLSLQAVASATGGTMLSGDPGLTVERYAIDSRHIDGGELFFALVGERNDGHDYLDEVFRRGAAAAVVSRPQEPAGPAVRVADTTAALRAAGPPEPLVPDAVLVPDFSGRTFALARHLAADESLEITTHGAIEGRVVSQLPVPGTVLEGDDRTVRLRFATGREEG